MPEHWRKVVFW